MPQPTTTTQPDPTQVETLYRTYLSANKRANEANKASATARKALLAYFGRKRYLALPNGDQLHRKQVARAGYTVPPGTTERIELLPKA